MSHSASSTAATAASLWPRPSTFAIAAGSDALTATTKADKTSSAQFTTAAPSHSPPSAQTSRFCLPPMSAQTQQSFCSPTQSPASTAPILRFSSTDSKGTTEYSFPEFLGSSAETRALHLRLPPKSIRGQALEWLPLLCYWCQSQPRRSLLSSPKFGATADSLPPLWRHRPRHQTCGFCPSSLSRWKGAQFARSLRQRARLKTLLIICMCTKVLLLFAPINIGKRLSKHIHSGLCLLKQLAVNFLSNLFPTDLLQASQLFQMPFLSSLLSLLLFLYFLQSLPLALTRHFVQRTLMQIQLPFIRILANRY